VLHLKDYHEKDGKEIGSGKNGEVVFIVQWEIRNGVKAYNRGPEV
jgi:hypothetical protein